MIAHAPHDPRGTAVVPFIVALATFEIIVAAIVFAGARADDLTTLRLDTTRALYAAEAGANMSLREEMAETDEDGDGKTGSISDDGDSNNDPALGVARVMVTATHAAGQATLTSTGRAGQARRRITLIIE